MELLVSGGYYDESGECWIERVAPGERRRVLTFSPPAQHRVPRKGFSGAARVGPDVVVCGFDAVWRFDANSWRCTGRLHQPDFNDLHGVTCDTARGLLLIANAGLDSIEVLGVEGDFRGRIALTPAWFEAARQSMKALAREDIGRALSSGWDDRPIPDWAVPGGTYYSGAAEEPFHRAKVRDYFHPNQILVRPDGRLLVSLLATREIRNLDDFSSFAKLDGHPHDGVRIADGWWVTTTDGRVWRLGDGGGVSLIVDTSRTGHIGWCRGLAVGSDWFAVGLTQVVSPPQYFWRSEPMGQSETAVLWFSRGDGRLLGRTDLTDPVRHSKVYTLLPLGGEA